MSDISHTLQERGARYGRFDEQAALSQALKSQMRVSLRTDKGGLTDEVIHEAIDHICTKLARIGNGDPYYADNWRDIVGYATLVLRELERAEHE